MSPRVPIESLTFGMPSGGGGKLWRYHLNCTGQVMMLPPGVTLPGRASS